MDDETQHLGRIFAPNHAPSHEADAQEGAPVFCPNCRSTDTVRYTSATVVAPAVAYFCRSCGRPFEHMLQ